MDIIFNGNADLLKSQHSQESLVLIMLLNCSNIGSAD